MRVAATSRARVTRATEPRRDSKSARTRFTFHGNARTTRHGWLRLTPAYSVELVRELLATARGPVLDPFCGTGTTLVACREIGLAGETVDLNPFLVWLARAKSATYRPADVDQGGEIVERMANAASRRSQRSHFVPDIHKVERWWDADTLSALAGACDSLTHDGSAGARARDLAKLAFCRTVIEVAHVTFGHQSMSFRERASAGRTAVAVSLRTAFGELAAAARLPLKRVRAKARLGDSRALDSLFGDAVFSTVITSPPYPNRMSYVRELRPYMYWLGYLTDRRQAGHLDWQAIGGTWGVATSNLTRWKPDPEVAVPFDGFDRLIRRIDAESPVLGRYVHRYFEDMTRHARGLAKVVAPEGSIHYVVGNSKFFDVVVPVERIFAALFVDAGFVEPTVRVLRKRTSKKELFEFLVSARKPALKPPGASRTPPRRGA